MSNSIYSFAAVPSSAYPNLGDMSTFAQMFRKMVMMMPHSTERGLLLGILDNPNDATRRRIYADWLEENGREDEAKVERQAAKNIEMLPMAEAMVGAGYITSGFIGGYPYTSVSSGLIGGSPGFVNVMPTGLVSGLPTPSSGAIDENY
jgi:uncharacterized protein (TIGR02996 family)